MKVFSGISVGTPPGGAIILGSSDGITLAVGLGVGFVDASITRLVPMMTAVALSVAVAVRDTTGVPLLVGMGMTGIGMVAESL
jgi:hypothetical protein